MRSWLNKLCKKSSSRDLRSALREDYPNRISREPTAHEPYELVFTFNRDELGALIAAAQAAIDYPMFQMGHRDATLKVKALLEQLRVAQSQLRDANGVCASCGNAPQHQGVAAEHLTI